MPAEYRRESTRAGGIEGGMTTGDLLVARVAMKPLATLNRPVLETVDVETKEDDRLVQGTHRRHRGARRPGVVAETMVALVLASEALRKFGGDSVAEFVRNHDAFRRVAVMASGTSCWSGSWARARRPSAARARERLGREFVDTDDVVVAHGRA